ncbi:hypothetical protein A2801_00155 [Candidatus Woesebacteria bacterium RIFCSPHIGHO2_01_FULL_41_10]|uniref:Putative phage metallopeptidase domain-containing protein n=1 Tax=Candidatus Woesebacteria bacterium RIFCSPHIGHO2_01_FULL_41_10 TaxID=1802500 RepID=A0A1F7YRI7_9BACT|nr:MAG: hypothetical protein A2801_00155 [Candidatus Woesebacteria bacterium RIFCSPHIGHO2_01_FULL_41_10]
MKRKSSKVLWIDAPDIKARIEHLVEKASIDWVHTERIACVRSGNSSARAYARIWGLNQVWQQVLDVPSYYCIEVLSEKFDHLPEHHKDEILLHELAHIPRTFSGALTPHTRRGKGSFHDKLKQMIAAYARSFR